MKPVDMLVLEQERGLLKRSMPVLQGLRSLDPPLFGKAILTCAFRFGRLHATDDMLALIDLLTPQYITEVLPAQMDEDPTFATLAERVATELVETDVVVPEYKAGGQFCYPEALA